MKDIDSLYPTVEAFSKALDLGAQGYRSVRSLDYAVRFDRSGYVERSHLGTVPPVAEMMKAPGSVPLLMTENCLLWKPAEFADRLVIQTKAIAELVGLPHDAPLDALYPKVAEIMKDREA